MDAFRIGHGYDSHRFGANRPLKLGGVEIPGAPGLRGHSDADALLHAIIDAVLGAAALGDIGSHFPDTDPAWRDADSALLLATVVREVRTAGWRVCDCVCQGRVRLLRSNGILIFDQCEMPG